MFYTTPSPVDCRILQTFKHEDDEMNRFCRYRFQEYHKAHELQTQSTKSMTKMYVYDSQLISSLHRCFPDLCPISTFPSRYSAQGNVTWGKLLLRTAASRRLW